MNGFLRLFKRHLVFLLPILLRRVLLCLVGLHAAACAVPHALGPQGLSVARPYQANPQLMNLTPYPAFQDQTGYLSYESPAQDPLPQSTFIRRVAGKSCQSGVQIPLFLLDFFMKEARFSSASFGLGDGSVREALADALTSVEPGQRLSDFTFDINTVSVLAVWRQTCLILTAAVTQDASVEVMPDDHNERPAPLMMPFLGSEGHPQ